MFNFHKLRSDHFQVTHLNGSNFGISLTPLSINLRLSDIEKLNYLISYLDGDALKIIRGLPIKSENY